MVQLWLNGRRMDSIPLLRRYTEGLDGHTCGAVCAELLGKYRSGQLSGWLRRQSEARPVSALRSALMGGEGPQLRLRRLMEDPDLPPEEAYPILAWLCGVDLERFSQAVEEMVFSLREQERARRQVEEQPWFRDDPRMRELFQDMDWSCVVCDTEGLTRALDAQGAGRSAQSGQRTLYLCNTGRSMTIRDPKVCVHLRLVGCGAPAVRFDSRNRGGVLDMEEQDLIFEGFSLSTQGMELLHTQQRLMEMEVE